jgi:hypothetical protein
MKIKLKNEIQLFGVGLRVFVMWDAFNGGYKIRYVYDVHLLYWYITGCIIYGLFLMVIYILFNSLYILLYCLSHNALLFSATQDFFHSLRAHGLCMLLRTIIVVIMSVTWNVLLLLTYSYSIYPIFRATGFIIWL